MHRMNCSDAELELQKMISLEITTNPQHLGMDHLELWHIVILKLVKFYQDEQLEGLWFSYIEALEQERGESDAA